MGVYVSKKAEKQLDEMPEELRTLFLKHFRKIESLPPRRHLKHGISMHVEEVTKQARTIYKKEGENTYITHCFRDRKEYEKWYKSYR